MTWKTIGVPILTVKLASHSHPRYSFAHVKFMASITARRVEGQSCHAPHVDTDRGQDSSGANAARESLLERAALRVSAWLDDDGDAL